MTFIWLPNNRALIIIITAAKNAVIKISPKCIEVRSYSSSRCLNNGKDVDIYSSFAVYFPIKVYHDLVSQSSHN